MIQWTAARPPVAERRDGPALLARALKAFREGRAVPVPSLSPGLIDARLNEELLAYVYARLIRSDHANLVKVGGVRERALALGRADQPEEAAATMKLARFFLSVAGFTPLGRVAADTLHEAAEAYLSYRRGDFSNARARIAAAIMATDRLADAWGESRFTTGRRLHLLHNLMRVEARRGASREAATIGAGILSHLAGSSAGPRLPELAWSATALEPLIADGFCDIVAATLAEVLAVVPDTEGKELLGLLASVAPGEPPSAALAWVWLPLKGAALADDPRPFLADAAPFLRAGRGRAAVLWYAVALDVVRAARRLSPGPVPEGVEEIASDLSSQPSVPECMQVAVREQVLATPAS